MSDESFLRRWSRKKEDARQAAPVAHQPPVPRQAPRPVASAARPATIPARPAPAPQAPVPTLDDVAALTSQSDFSAFMTDGVDQAVRRLAMKKLFSDPHFGVMDGLDVYIDDYNKADPLPAAMLASLEHAKSVFARFLKSEPDEAAPLEGAPRTPPEREA